METGQLQSGTCWFVDGLINAKSSIEIIDDAKLVVHGSLAVVEVNIFEFLKQILMKRV